MRKTVRLIVVLASLAVPAAAAAVTEGCSQPIVPTSAISAAETAAHTASVVVSDAQAVWPFIYAAIPAAQQPAAQDAYNKAVFTANHAILALNDAIQAAIAANNSNPDFSAILSQLGDAVSQVVAIVQSFQAPVAAKMHVTESGVDAFADMQSAAAKIKALVKK